jgi:ATP-dependent DNA helicase RecG
MRKRTDRAGPNSRGIETSSETESTEVAASGAGLLHNLLARNEGKTLEFKETAGTLRNIVRTVVAFANTAGGDLLLGVRDRTREVTGVKDALDIEERLANTFSDSISPLLMPDMQIVSWRNRELVVITVPHSIGPYYVKNEGPDSGVYVRLGSTNRRADAVMIEEIRRLARNSYFDEQPRIDIDSEAIDFRAASEFFARAGRNLTPAKYRPLGLITEHQGRPVPTQGAILLFGTSRRTLFPDALIRCARLAGSDRNRFLDQVDEQHLRDASLRRVVQLSRLRLEEADWLKTQKTVKK